MTFQSIGERYLLYAGWLWLIPHLVYAQGTAPTFETKVNDKAYTLAGGDVAKGGTTTIGTVVVPLKLAFEAKGAVLDAGADVARLLRSPLFTPFAFSGAAKMQYPDAMMRTTFPEAADWHTVLGQPEVKPVGIRVPVGYGYVLQSRMSGRRVGIVDVEWLQKELFRLVPKQPGKLVIAVSHNVAYYALGDATVCCSWGTHGVDSATGNSFVLASYLHEAPAIVQDRDVQPVSQQLAQFMKDPLNDPLLDPRQQGRPGNRFPAWMRPAAMKPGDQGNCGGTGAASTYFLLEPTDTNPKNNFPASRAFVAGGYHLENVALLGWYTGTGSVYSFPDPNALRSPAEACPERGRRRPINPKPTVAAVPLSGAPNGHKLIGYWAGYGGPGSTIPMRELSPQWDIIIVAFAIPDKNAPEGTMLFRTPGGLDKEQFKGDIAWLKSQGKKVMISLGGGGQHFTLADPKRVPNFVASVTRIVEDYGFDGIDVDFESPSLSIAPGDTDFRNPTTPSIVNLISALRQVQAHFGPKFMLSLVPEGTQIPAGYPSYGGQFGSYLPIAYALRDSLAFMDVQDYNTPPLQGLDGEIYQAGTVDYHAAVTELVLHGFPVGGGPKQMFPAFPANKVAVGFLTGDTTPTVVSQAMDYIITGKAPAGATYKLRKAGGYPGMLGAMFWTIDADRRGNYLFSNVIGPQLHRYQ
ncbi:MAG: glycoside hydrolase [Bryobacterales bacterium]|nr:glycoside hydrolase [Bryobacterales bacterium]